MYVYFTRICLMGKKLSHCYICYISATTIINCGSYDVIRTITGNFGNMMPIDWSKSTTRAKQLPTLNLVKHILNKLFVETFNNLATMVLHKL